MTGDAAAARSWRFQSPDIYNYRWQGWILNLKCFICHDAANGPIHIRGATSLLDWRFSKHQAEGFLAMPHDLLCCCWAVELDCSTITSLEKKSSLFCNQFALFLLFIYDTENCKTYMGLCWGRFPSAAPMLTPGDDYFPTTQTTCWSRKSNLSKTWSIYSHFVLTTTRGKRIHFEQNLSGVEFNWKMSPAWRFLFP